MNAILSQLALQYGKTTQTLSTSRNLNKHLTCDTPCPGGPLNIAALTLSSVDGQQERTVSRLDGLCSLKISWIHDQQHTSTFTYNNHNRNKIKPKREGDGCCPTARGWRGSLPRPSALVRSFPLQTVGKSCAAPSIQYPTQPRS